MNLDRVVPIGSCILSLLLFLVPGLTDLTASGLFAQTAGEKRRAERAEKKIVRAINKLNEKKEHYDGLRSAYKGEVKAVFDTSIKNVTASNWSVDVRNAVARQLEEAKASFEEDGALEKIPALQRTYVAYIVASLRAYSKLMKAYDLAMKSVPREDSRYKELQSEIEEYAREINSTDALQVGSVWKGYRSDFGWGPGYKVEKGEDSVLRLTKFRNDRVDVTWQLEIKKRQGRQIEGEISQRDKRFLALVKGTFDGVNLKLKMTRMLKGADRYFEYSGQVAGNLGRLALRGRKTNSALTTGMIVIECVSE